MIDRFDQLSLRTKIVIGFAALIALTLIVGGASLASHRRALAAVDTFLDRDNQIAELSLRSNAAMLKARRNEKDFLLKIKEFGYEETKSRYATLVQAHLATVRENMAAIRALADDADVVGETRAIEQITNRYETGFLQVVELYGRLGRRDAGLEGQFRIRAHAIEALLAEGAPESLMTGLLTLRRAEKDYLLRGSTLYADAFDLAMSRYREKIGRTALPAQRKAELLRLTAEYRELFRQYVAVNTAIATASLGYLGAVHTMEPQLEHLHAHVGEAAAATRATLHRLTQAATWTVAGASLGALMLGLAVAFFISRNVNHTLREIIEFAGNVAEGKLAARLRPGSRNEFGVLIDALNRMAAGIAEDILHREQVAAALLKSEQTSRAIVENAIDAFIAIGDDGRIENWNPQAEAIFGWPRAQAIGLALHETIIPPKLREAHQQDLKRFLETGEGPMLNKRIELTALHRDGHEFPVELTISALNIQHNITFNAFVRDISDRKRAEAELKDIHGQLVEVSRNAGMAEVATNILHNVGNVLNSVNVSASLVVERVQQSKVSGLAKVVALLQEHKHDPGAFITSDTRGKHLPDYLAQLSEQLRAEQEAIATELGLLQSNIDHIKEIVTFQQGYAKRSGMQETVNIIDVLENSVNMNVDALSRHGVEIIREFENVPLLILDRHKVLQILVNLIVNAKYACAESGRTVKRLTLRVANGDGRIQISVIDNGVGITPENLTRIFNHGFTTRKDGHGFGLHSGAVAAQELGGSLSAHSKGAGCGATFTLELPVAAQECAYA